MEIIETILSPIGGLSLVLVALFAWLGKLWMGRILEMERNTHRKEIEEIKALLNLKTDEIKLEKSLFKEKQFVAVQDLWDSMCDLRVATRFAKETDQASDLDSVNNKLYDAYLLKDKCSIFFNSKELELIEIILYDSQRLLAHKKRKFEYKPDTNHMQHSIFEVEHNENEISKTINQLRETIYLMINGNRKII